MELEEFELSKQDEEYYTSVPDISSTVSSSTVSRQLLWSLQGNELQPFLGSLKGMTENTEHEFAVKYAAYFTRVLKEQHISDQINKYF